MPIIDLTSQPARGQGQLNKFSVKADGRDEEAFVYDVDVVFTVASSAEAEVVGRVVPGAKEAYQRATERDDWKCQQTVVPDIEGARVVIGQEGEEAALQGGAEIRAVTMRASKRAVTITVKCRCAGQTGDPASRLTGLLRSPVDLLVEGAQQVLPFAGKGAPLVQLGAVVVGRDEHGTTVWGRVHDMDHEAGVALLDVFGEGEVPAKLDAITSAWALVPGDPTEKALRAYKAASKKAKLAPSYRAITVAMGEAYAAEPPADGKHHLTPEVVARAVELARAGFGDGEVVTVRRKAAGLA